MGSNAVKSFGTLLKRGDGATPEVFTAIAEMGDIKGPVIKVGTDDVTNHSSPGGIEERIPTTINVGEISAPVNFLHSNATHNYTAGVLYDLFNRVKHNYQLVFPDSTTWTLSCYVIGCEFNQVVKGAQKATITWDVVGITPA